MIEGRKVNIDQVAPKTGFTHRVEVDMFEKAAKFRVARRVWRRCRGTSLGLRIPVLARTRCMRSRWGSASGWAGSEQLIHVSHPGCYACWSAGDTHATGMMSPCVFQWRSL
nr:hypothetical protein [Desulfobacterales bacterium]